MGHSMRATAFYERGAGNRTAAYSRYPIYSSEGEVATHTLSKAPLLANNARNGAPLNFRSGMWTTRPALVRNDGYYRQGTEDVKRSVRAADELP